MLAAPKVVDSVAAQVALRLSLGQSFNRLWSRLLLAYDHEASSPQSASLVATVARGRVGTGWSDNRHLSRTKWLALSNEFWSFRIACRFQCRRVPVAVA